MTDTTPPALPTERLVLDWPAGTPETDETREAFDADAHARMLAFVDVLRARGERPWFEVWQRGFPGRDDKTADTFDAVEVAEDGTISTLPPYATILAGGAA